MLYEVDVVVKFKVEQDSEDHASAAAINLLDETFAIVSEDNMDRMTEETGVMEFSFGSDYKVREA